MTGQDTAEALEALRGQLETYDPDRYPVQHATARFHLGTMLIQTGRPDEAARHLRRASELFPLDGLAVEQAKTTNMLGVALRDLGRPEAAAEAFERAAGILSEQDQRLEAAAARYNHGLVLVELGDASGAEEAFGSARTTFVAAGALGQAAAAGRELGALLLEAGKLERAADVLAEAVEHAADAGEQAVLGAAANTLGLVQLEAGDHAAARRAFEDAAGGHPRSVRPEGYAMARANLALACERDGHPARARLAARQALGSPSVPEPVAEQARQVLARLEDEPGDLHAVLAEEPPEAWSGLLRAELRRLADAAGEERARHAASWVAGQLERSEAATDLAEAYLEVLLELPPESMESLIAALVTATGERDQQEAERFRRTTARAMARFHVPQLMRLRDAFNRLAAESGEREGWG